MSTRLLFRGGLATFLLAVAVSAEAQRPVELAPNAPPDRPISATLRCQVTAMMQAIAPLSAEARSTFPATRQRFEQGLPSRHTFFVSTWLRDSLGRQELAFVAVDSITGSDDELRIAGRIWNQIHVVRGFAFRHSYSFAIEELVDWMIARPDGSEEGNEVDKFLDTYQPPASCADTTEAG